MTDGEVTFEELDRLDAAWDDRNRGQSSETARLDRFDAAALRSLRVAVDVPPPVSRRIWSNACALSTRAQRPSRRHAATQGGRALHLATPTSLGWDWLPAGFTAAIAALVIVGGIFFAGNDGGGVTQTLPSDASSVVATLPSAAPAWGTPGGDITD